METSTDNSIVSTSPIAIGLWALGVAGGLSFAYYKKSGTWGYIGFALLGGLIGNGVGLIVAPPKKEDKTTN